MKLKSETLSNVLKILLWVLVGLACADLAGSIVYAASLEAFSIYVYDFYGFIEIVSAILYYVVAIVYLIWIYRVHMDLNALFPHFTRSPGMSLASMLVPVYNLYGIPSIYSTIGRWYQEHTDGAKQDGRWIARLAAPLLLFTMVTNVLNRIVSQVDELSGSLFLTLSLSTFILYAIFLTLCIQVTRGLQTARIEASSGQPANLDSDGYEAPSVEQPILPHQL
ncbi:hypothetical protein FHS18_004504 [Paenibacillus phyllosphaerae]|uniref:DUF4328 domain-containing protein n=1 Tax=Paenibacillus phyllosphaerae TaxID=274593 RepID=A0A7W5B116_9BACL|nr:DUF4328 domain-containing protein [Paenibacillus phyllosphaerae]MBB3112403.1 hypothetical protein [Paenibacillus phyllosphaerae]